MARRAKLGEVVKKVEAVVAGGMEDDFIMGLKELAEEGGLTVVGNEIMVWGGKVEYWREWEQEEANRAHGVDQKPEAQERILEVEQGWEEDKGKGDEDWKKSATLELEQKGYLKTEEVEPVKELEEYRDVFVLKGVKLPAMQGGKMEIRLVEGGDKKLKQCRGYRLGEVDSLVLERKLKEWMRIGVVKTGSPGKGR